MSHSIECSMNDGRSSARRKSLQLISYWKTWHEISVYLFCYHVHSGQAWVQLEAFWDPRSEVLRLLAFHETTLSGQDCMVCSASSQKMIDLFENEKHFVRVRRPNDPRDFVFNCDHTGAVVLVKSEHGAISQHILNPQNPFCGTSELIFLAYFRERVVGLRKRTRDTQRNIKKGRRQPLATLASLSGTFFFFFFGGGGGLVLQTPVRI